jgi:GTP-binding protein
MQKDPADPSMGNMGRFATMVQHAFRSMSYMPLAFVTAQTGRNVKALVNLAQSLFKQSRNRVGTGTLNRILREAVEAHPPSSRENRAARIYYATQVGVTPPTVVLFVNSTKLFDQTYQRYLLNVFRERLPFRDIPIKLYMRSRRQADEAPERSSTEEDWEGPTGTIDEGQALAGAEIPGHTPRGGHFDVASRFLNHEVNELLSDLDK